ncbi:MAG: glycoside hydrolase family 32 protein [Chloroflexi bacterium]|nr:glycoside hydrolase family 32 protein [Chloroflexota bacterium]
MVRDTSDETDRTMARPTFHFTPPSQWMNDPNGLIYSQGEYHLFYQYHPHGMLWGPMHWGHAVSADLVEWTHLPIALYPDENGAIFSGSIVNDRDNTSGLVAGGGLVAVFSFDTQAQGIAYSSDQGRTWTKYAGNPVIPSPKRDFRDPKVFWYAPDKVWVMLLVAGDHALIYRSPNLIEWTQVSTFGAPYGSRAGVWECPDLFPLEIDGATKWVLIISVGDGAVAGGSGTQYFIGSFDGKTFMSENPPEHILWLDYGPDNYAGVTYNDTPDGQRVLVAWMSNWQYARVIPAQGWRGSMAVPRTLRLENVHGQGIRLAQAPIMAIDTRRTQVTSQRNVAVEDAAMILSPLPSRALDIEVEFDARDAEEFGLRICTGETTFTTIGIAPLRGEVFIDRRASGNTAFHEEFGAVLRGPLLGESRRVSLRVLADSESIEVFVNGGLTTLTALIFPPDGETRLAAYAETGEVRLSRLDVYAL